MLSEASIQHDVIRAVNRSGRAWVARCNSGFIDGVRFGLGRGTPDLIGMLTTTGRFFALEVKSARGRLSDDQRRWAHAARQRGAFVAVVRSVEDAIDAISRAESGADE